MRKSFTFHEEWRNAIQHLPVEIRAEIYDAIIEYALSGTMPEISSPIVLVSFNFIKESIDNDNVRYEAICERNRINGSKSKGRPQKPNETQDNPTKPKKPTGLLGFEGQIESNGKQSDNQSVKPKKPNGLSGLFEKENSPIPPKERKERDSSLSSESLSTDVDSEALSPACEEIVDFYNKAVEGKLMAKCRKLTDVRIKAIKARLQQFGTDQVYEAITRAANSEFCNGANDRNWVADFDFVFNANKMTKILEGKYDNRNNNNYGNSRPNYQNDGHPSDNEMVGIALDVIEEFKAKRRNSG